MYPLGTGCCAQRVLTMVYLGLGRQFGDGVGLFTREPIPSSKVYCQALQLLLLDVGETKHVLLVFCSDVCGVHVLLKRQCALIHSQLITLKRHEQPLIIQSLKPLE